jgi:hypothetical protein
MAKTCAVVTLEEEFKRGCYSSTTMPSFAAE